MKKLQRQIDEINYQLEEPQLYASHNFRKWMRELAEDAIMQEMPKYWAGFKQLARRDLKEKKKTTKPKSRATGG